MTPTDPSPFPSDAPTAGTGDLLPFLRERWQRARAGQGVHVHLQGPPGSGKTTLLRRLADAVATPGDEAFVVFALGADAHGLDVRETANLETLILRIAEGMRALDASEGRAPAGPNGAPPVPWLLPGGDFFKAALGIAALPAPAGLEVPPRARVHADLLLEVTWEHPVLLLVDDAHRVEPASRRILEDIARGLATDAPHRLMLVTTAATPVAEAETGAFVHAGVEVPGTPLPLPAVPPSVLAERLAVPLQRSGEPDAEWLEAVATAACGNPRIAAALVNLSERAGAFKRTDRARVLDPEWTRRPGHDGLVALAQGRLPALPASVRADLQAAAVQGGPLDVALMARFWDVPPETARQRILAIEATGLIEPVGHDGQQFAFLTPELARQLAERLPDPLRQTMQVRMASLLRAGTRSLPGQDEPRRPGLDVTETWSESRRREHRTREELDRLARCARLFAGAQRHAAAAEAGVTLVERLFETGGNPFVLAGRWGRREDRERRLHIHATLLEAAAELDLARTSALEPGPDAELLSVNARVTTMRARYKEAMGDFTEARRLAAAAVEMALHCPEHRLRMHTLRTQLEVHYSSGDHNGGREVLLRFLSELARAPREDAARLYGWLAEALSRWEWAGLHERLFPHLIEQIRAAGDDRGVVRARLERLVSAQEVDGHPPVLLLQSALDEARALRQLPYAAERLAQYAAEMIQAVVDSHHDSLSGEFYPPDLFGEGLAPGAPTIIDRFEWPMRLMEQSDELAREADHRIARLRVLTTMLGVVYEVRERCGDLLDRWMPEYGEQRPVRLLELLELLQHGFFSAEHLESITERTILLAQNLGLDQVLADTLYEALDRELPGVVRRSDTFLGHARNAYERVGDAYGLITLLLVQARLVARHSGTDALTVLEEAGDIAEARATELTSDQQAFIAFRLGELMLQLDAGAETEAVTGQLERAIELYDRAGDVEHVQIVGEMLRDLYKKSGDFGRYRLLRERFRALESRAPGIDPLGLELRIEHLLSLARQEQNEERAIEMVERCVRLFGRMPDSTTRIDECFVEISKICRRRADEAQTEEGFQDWLRRSLEAVRVATGINRSLGNFHRVFEEMHEMFDDLVGMGAFDEYVAARAEGRDLAFAVGQVPELLTLFDEHLQLDPDSGFDTGRLPEVRGFFEALLRYLLGLGARTQALSLQRSFTSFLTAVGEHELSDHYRRRPPLSEA